MVQMPQTADAQLCTVWVQCARATWARGSNKTDRKSCGDIRFVCSGSCMGNVCKIMVHVT